MALRISSLNSGSNGNCYYIGNSTEAVLIDAGISCREVEKRMNLLGLAPQLLKAIFVSHEHSDHIAGVAGISKKYQLPVYITASTLHKSRLPLAAHLVVPFSVANQVSIGALAITAFTKNHDACDPHSFTVADQEVRVGIFTDIGTPCANLVRHFKDCHAAFLEANYDNDMLINGSYPWHLKKRISGGNGHLSNKEALDLFMTHRPVYMSHLVLSHLSKNNNCPELVKTLFQEQAGDTSIIVASRYDASAVFEVNSGFVNSRAACAPTVSVRSMDVLPAARPLAKRKLALQSSQLSLFT